MFDYTAAELERIDETLEPKLAWAKDRHALCEQLALDASRLLSCVEDRLDDYRGQGFFRRCWSSLSGKTGAEERANQRDLVEMQKYAWRYINLLQERDLLLAHSVISVKNNLLSLAVAQNEVKSEITRLANRVYDRFVALEQRVGNIEVSQAIHSWLLTIGTYDYDERYPINLRLLRVIGDFYALKPGEWSAIELKYLQKALTEAGLDPKKVMTVSGFVDGVIDEIDHLGFGVFSPLIDPVASRELDNDFIADSISSPAFNALYQIKGNYTASSRVIKSLSKRFELSHTEAIKITLKDFIEEQGIDMSAKVPLRDLAIEILGCMSLAGRLADVAARPGAPVSAGDVSTEDEHKVVAVAVPLIEPKGGTSRGVDASQWRDSLVQCLRKFEGGSLYVEEKIPEKKLKNATRKFPIDPLDDVVALIDSTVFGSCDNGMAFGKKGVYWKNDWATKSIKNFLSWGDLTYLKSGIKHQSYDLIFEDGCACNFSGSGIDAETAKNIILSLIEQYEKSFCSTVQSV